MYVVYVTFIWLNQNRYRPHGMQTKVVVSCHMTSGLESRGLFIYFLESKHTHYTATGFDGPARVSGAFFPVGAPIGFWGAPQGTLYVHTTTTPREFSTGTARVLYQGCTKTHTHTHTRVGSHRRKNCERKWRIRKTKQNKIVEGDTGQENMACHLHFDPIWDLLTDTWYGSTWCISKTEKGQVMENNRVD